MKHTFINSETQQSMKEWFFSVRIGSQGGFTPPQKSGQLVLCGMWVADDEGASLATLLTSVRVYVVTNCVRSCSTCRGYCCFYSWSSSPRRCTRPRGPSAAERATRSWAPMRKVRHWSLYRKIQGFYQFARSGLFPSFKWVQDSPGSVRLNAI